MQQINVDEFYQLGSAVHPLTELKPGGRLKDYFYTNIFARMMLNNLVADTIIPMTICRPIAHRLMKAIDQLFPTDPALTDKVNFDREATPTDLYYIIQRAKEFEVIFSAELQNMATYFVSKKAIYDTNDLIQRANEMFPDSIRASLPDRVQVDLKEGGKCLAFDLATAAGFHIARAVEGVLIDYLDIVVPPAELAKLKDTDRNLGRYIKILRENGGDPKIVTALEQFKDLHRNPLMHPDAVLELDEALTLLGIAQSSITVMAMDKINRTSHSSGAIGLLDLAGRP